MTDVLLYKKYAIMLTLSLILYFYMTDEEVSAVALDFAKKNKKRIANELTDKAIYVPDKNPISVFMAGSPGAGKTEYSKSLVGRFENFRTNPAIRIDGDEIRKLMPNYTGDNSRLFQSAISVVVEKVHDLALHNKQNFIFDGTFSKYEKANNNIRRSLSLFRPVSIFYIYQAPEVAWKFTKAREFNEGRNIPKSAFIEQFFGVQDSINRIRKEFGADISILLVTKDFELNEVKETVELTQNGPSIADYIKKTYTKEELENIL